MGIWLMQQGHVAEDTAHPPHILVFKIAAVTPAQHHYRQPVAACPQERRHVKLRRQTAILGVAHPLPVAPEVKGGIDAVKDQSRLTAFQPAGVHIECERVTTGRVLSRDKGRIHRNRISDVGVDRRIKALHLPVGGNGHHHRIRAILLRPAVGNLLGCRKEAELPVTVEQADGRGWLLIPRGLLVTPAAQRDVGRKSVPLGDTGIFPVTTGKKCAEGQRSRMGHSYLFAKRSQFMATMPCQVARVKGESVMKRWRSQKR